MRPTRILTHSSVQHPVEHERSMWSYYIESKFFRNVSNHTNDDYSFWFLTIKNIYVFDVRERVPTPLSAHQRLNDWSWTSIIIIVYWRTWNWKQQNKFSKYFRLALSMTWRAWFPQANHILHKLECKVRSILYIALRPFKYQAHRTRYTYTIIHIRIVNTAYPIPIQ